MGIDLLKKYRNAVTHLLNEPADAGLMKPFINDLKNYLGNITSISTDLDMNDWNDKNTSQGVAISPVQAAKCTEEKRTLCMEKKWQQALGLLLLFICHYH